MLNQVTTGDAFVLANQIEDASVDMIFCDPEYSKLNQYEWLGQVGKRVLKKNGSMLVFGSDMLLPQYRSAIEAAGFRYNWTLKYTVEAKGSFLSGLKLVVWTTPCLWFSLGRPKPRHHFVDTFRSVEAPFGRYKWNKNPACIEAWMEPLTTKGNVIFDPFSGSGPVAYACRRLKRNYLSFEIDPKVAEMSRRQIAKANPPLFLLEDISQSQMELNDERKPRRRKLPQTSG
jgi:hypothetical protein